MKHISISINNDLPSIESVEMILNEFKFKNKLNNCMVYLEENAVNVLEKVKE